MASYILDDPLLLHWLARIEKEWAAMPSAGKDAEQRVISWKVGANVRNTV